VIILCSHCSKEVSCDCQIKDPNLNNHILDCKLRLFLAGSSHNGAGRRNEFEAKEEKLNV